MPEPDVAYALVFDVCRDGYRYWWFPAIGVVFGILCFIEDHVLKRGRIRPLPPRRRFPAGWATSSASSGR
jgi:hypothetical protein